MLDRLISPEILALLIPIIAVSGVFSYLILRSRMQHRERMAMIEQGMHPDRQPLADPDDDDHDLLEP